MGDVLPERVRRAAGATWAFRARAELDAEARFRAIAGGLASVGAPSGLIALASRSADDERRHHVRCVEAAGRFGVEVGAQEPPVGIVEPASREQLLLDVIAMCCVTETVSAALLTEMLRETTEPRLHEIVREILTDEVTHSRIGWGHLAFEAGRGDLGFVGAALPRILQGTVQEELFAEPPADDVGHQLLAYGALPRERRRDIFVGAVRQLVLPGLAQHGVEVAAAQAWLDARAA